MSIHKPRAAGEQRLSLVSASQSAQKNFDQIVVAMMSLYQKTDVRHQMSVLPDL
jgi:hypothetical protein